MDEIESFIETAIRNIKNIAQNALLIDFAPKILQRAKNGNEYIGFFLRTLGIISENYGFAEILKKY